MSTSEHPAPVDLNRILIVKLADHGDAVLATSAISALRSTFPGARIDVLTANSGAAVFRMCDAVDDVITLDKDAFDSPAGLLNPVSSMALFEVGVRLRRTRYDAIVLLHHLTTRFGALKFHWLCWVVGAPVRAGLDNGRGDFLTHRAIDYGFGARSVHDYGLDVVSLLGATRQTRPSITVPESARRSVQALLEHHGLSGDYVIIHPGVGGYSTARNWHPERFAAVANAIAVNHGLPVVLVGARDSHPAADTIRHLASVTNLVGLTSFPELAAVLERARLVLGADSGVVHLAAALDTPTIAIFGPSNHREWKPFGAQILSQHSPPDPSRTVFVVRSEIPCSPCFYSGYSLGRREGCALRTCLDQISHHQVAEIAAMILSQNHVPKSTTH